MVFPFVPSHTQPLVPQSSPEHSDWIPPEVSRLWLYYKDLRQFRTGESAFVR